MNKQIKGKNYIGWMNEGRNEWMIEWMNKWMNSVRVLFGCERATLNVDFHRNYLRKIFLPKHVSGGSEHSLPPWQSSSYTTVLVISTGVTRLSQSFSQRLCFSYYFYFLFLFPLLLNILDLNKGVGGFAHLTFNPCQPDAFSVMFWDRTK